MTDKKRDDHFKYEDTTRQDIKKSSVDSTLKRVKISEIVETTIPASLRESEISQVSNEQKNATKGNLEKTITYQTKGNFEETITYSINNDMLEKTISYDQSSEENNFYLKKRIGRYHVFEEIGSGGFGTVYRGLDPHLHREIALKTIHCDKLTSSEIEHFEKEARTLARCNHPNIVQIYDVGKNGNDPFIVMEFISGLNLCKQIAKERASKDASRVQQIICSHMIDLVGALNYMHKHKMYHQDIKPNNIIVSAENNCAKLVDFGLAVNQFDKENSKKIIGTYAYMPPEKFERKGSPQMHDIYALGIVFYEMLTGRVAHPGKNVTEIVEHIFHSEVTFQESDTADKELQRICLKCIHRDPQKRYQGLREFYDDLVRFSGNALEINDSPYLFMVIDNKKLIFPLTNKINFLGRTFANHIVIPDIAISRSQAIIKIEDNVKIKNLSEVNKITIGRRVLGFDEETQLRGHEIIQIADYKFHYIPRGELCERQQDSWGENTIKMSAPQQQSQVIETQIDNHMWERTITTDYVHLQNSQSENTQVRKFIEQLRTIIGNFENQLKK